MTRLTAVIPSIVERHFDDAAFLFQLRRRACMAPDWSLADLGNLDLRLEAHLDGLRVVGEHGWNRAETALQEGPNELCVAGVLAIESRDRTRIGRVLREAVKSTEMFSAVIASFERVAPKFLQGTIKDLLGSQSPVGRQIGIAACLSHGVNPGIVLDQLIEDSNPDVTAWAIRACAELGLIEHQGALTRERPGADDGIQWWMAVSSVLFGNRGLALNVITRRALGPGPYRSRAFPLMLQALDTTSAHGALQQLAQDSQQLPRLIQGTGIVGDPTYIPWIIRHMARPDLSRLAGEAFSLITGLDLKAAKLDAPRPDDFKPGPNDDPSDPNVDMDPDDGLPWPTAEHVQKWWDANARRLTAGARYFMGAPVTREHCIDVLKNGYQRQRILAAHYLCLLDPGTPLFNTSAPAWRQQRLLAEMR